jgi:hypothetical protein
MAELRSEQAAARGGLLKGSFERLVEARPPTIGSLMAGPLRSLKGTKIAGVPLLGGLEKAYPRAVPTARAALRETAPFLATLGMGVPVPVWGPRTGRNINQFVESWHKLTHVMGKLRQGYNLDMAILSAKNALFDYSDLTMVERVVARPLFPFWTWFSKNLHLMGRSLATRPGIINNTKHLVQAIENAADPQSAPVDRTVVPDWFKQGIFASTQDKYGIVSTYFINGMGLHDAAEFVGRPVDALWNRVHFLVNTAGSLASGRDLSGWNPGKLPLAAAEAAPPIFEQFPKWFKDVMGFRMDWDAKGNPKGFRADPRMLQILRSAGSPLGRFTSTLSRLSQFRVPRETDPYEGPLGLRTNIGLDLRKQPYGAQAATLLIGMLEKVEDDLMSLTYRTGLVREGEGLDRPDFKKAKEGVLIFEPDRLKEIRKLQADSRKLRMALRKLGVNVRAKALADHPEVRLLLEELMGVKKK